jgi:assimilatory nitrate reductase catalytic subunit
MSQAPEPILDIHPSDAARFGISNGGVAEISSSWGRAVARVRHTADQKPGHVFLPMHWTDSLSARGTPSRVVNPACDAVSGQPELKHTPARVQPLNIRWEGTLLSPRRFRPRGLTFWSRNAIAGGYAYRLAGEEPIGEGILLGLSLMKERRDVFDIHDRKRGVFRAANFDAGGVLAECLLVAPPGQLPDTTWLANLFASGAPVPVAERLLVLAARAGTASASEGKIVCSCFGVGEPRILRAIGDGARDTDALGRLLRCGTNCGSCLPELRDLISREAGGIPETAHDPESGGKDPLACTI